MPRRPVVEARAGRIALRILRLLLVVAAIVALPLAYVVQPIGCVSRAESPGRVDPARLRSHVETLSRSLAPRTAMDRENLDRAAEFIRAGFAAAGVDAAFEPFDVRGRSYRNVIARIGPETGERIIVGAHYDAAGPGIGADDNASGVAGLLELAPLIRDAALPLRVELVAYTLEEPPYFRTRAMGSYVHAQELVRSGATVRAMICLEMIGCFHDEPGSQHYPMKLLALLYPDKGDFITVVGCLGQAGLVRRVKRAMIEAADLPVWSINAPRSLPGIDFSDHLNYWDAGFEAVMVTDTAFYRNTQYHESGDGAETLDYERMAVVVEQVLAAVTALSRDP